MAREQRRLAAIVAADVVGYSRLVGRDESGTVARLREHLQQRFEPTLGRHGGRLVKLTGDGALVEFRSAVDALGAAVEFQQAMVEANRDQPEDARIVFRIGLHLGDLIVDGDDLYGDGVNVAARLEAEAPPGGIVISGDVHNAIVGRLKAGFEDLGKLSLKNIERPVQAFRVKWEPADWKVAAPTAKTPSIAPAPAADAPLALPDKPSIAVLPFQNISGDRDQDYFADGMVEDIITGLSRSKQLFVIARNSSFAYKGKSPDIRLVGRELGVRYVLEGSVRKSGNRVRITGQLIEAESGTHIWADRFDGDLEDIFELQDQVTSNVIGGIAPSLDSAEMERARRKTGNLQAYDYCLRSRAAASRFTAEDNAEAQALARKAVALDPDFALGHATLAFTHIQRRSFGWTVDRAGEAEEAERAARHALALDIHDARVLTYCGQILFIVAGRAEEAAAHFDQAVEIDPNYALGWTYRGAVRIALGEPEKAVGDLERALRHSPIEPGRFYALALMARARTLCGHYDKALPLVAASLRLRPNFPPALLDSMVAHALAGQLDLARQSLVAYEKVFPAVRLATFREQTPYLSVEGLEKYVEALRIVGVRE